MRQAVFRCSVRDKQKAVSESDTGRVGVTMSKAKRDREKKGKSLLCFPETYCVIDIETTGLDPRSDEIIELAGIKIEGGKEAARFQSLVKPVHEISPFITGLTGITNEMVSDAPSIEHVLLSFRDFIGDSVLVGHNINFDINFLYDVSEWEQLSPLSNDYVDTLRISRRLYKEIGSHTLKNLVRFFAVADSVEHRALSDCERTNQCLLRMKTEANLRGGIPESSYSQFMHIQARPKPSEIVCTVEQIDKNCPLCGKKLVFTGALSISRAEAMQIAVNSGAKIMTAVSRKTDYLIVGWQDKALVGDDGMSSKEEKAYALNAEGKASIRIIDEAEFLRLAQERDADYE